MLSQRAAGAGSRMVAPDSPMSAYDYDLPTDRIAQHPPGQRDASRLLHVPLHGAMEDRDVRDLPVLLAAGDLLVVNDTRVRAARLRGIRSGGGAAEILVLDRVSSAGAPVRHRCLVRPARRLPPGTVVQFAGGLTATVCDPAGTHPGEREVILDAGGVDVDIAIAAVGTLPLPPYIREALADSERYQTVYSEAAPAVSAAAATAGLHFTHDLLDRLRTGGVDVATIRLEVGLGTFAPITAADAADHVMHEERYQLPAAAAAAVAAARSRGGRVIAVGTTSLRVLETCAAGAGLVAPGSGVTRLYLRPGHPLRAVDGLLTNFHHPRSSLLLLVAAVVGTNRWRAAYAHALESGYRFLSFGDCMLAWREGPLAPGPRPAGW